MVVADLLVQETYTEKLKVPDGFQVTLPENRTWIIEPLGSDDIGYTQKFWRPKNMRFLDSGMKFNFFTLLMIF